MVEPPADEDLGAGAGDSESELPADEPVPLPFALRDAACERLPLPPVDDVPLVAIGVLR